MSSDSRPNQRGLTPCIRMSEFRTTFPTFSEKSHDLIAEKVVLMFSVYCLLVIELYDDGDECLQSDNDETFRNNRGGICKVKQMKPRLVSQTLIL